MGDGWETRRRREPGHDWILVRLGATAEIEKVEVDTAHFKGNYRTDVPFRPQWQVMKPMKNWLPRQKTGRNSYLRKNFRWISNIFSKTAAAGFGAGQLCPLEYFLRTAESAASGFLDVPSSENRCIEFHHSAYRSGLC